MTTTIMSITITTITTITTTTTTANKSYRDDIGAVTSVLGLDDGGLDKRQIE